MPVSFSDAVTGSWRSTAPPPKLQHSIVPDSHRFVQRIFLSVTGVTVLAVDSMYMTRIEIINKEVNILNIF
jgi:hypothetical protein